MTTTQHLPGRARDHEAGMLRQLCDWVGIASGSNDEAGLSRMLDALTEAFEELPGELEVVACTGESTGDEAAQFPRFALRLRRKGELPGKPVLLNGHYDTVYGPESSFRAVTEVGPRRLRGPGVTDMKGGLVVLLHALKLWESGPHAGSIGWEVLITPDEEIGSAASLPLLKEAARNCGVGLVYESALVDGAFVRRRMGSARYVLRVKGRAAHVGRNFEEGRNAILALAGLCPRVAELAEACGVTANLGKIEGGGPLNVVPDAACAQWNVRSSKPEAFSEFEARVRALPELAGEAEPDGLSFCFEGDVNRPPKEVDAATQALFDDVARVAGSLGQSVAWRDTGGGSDGSLLAAFGLPNIDNLGVRGGAIHSPEEFIEVDSLVERTELTLAILDAVRCRDIFPFSQPNRC